VCSAIHKKTGQKVAIKVLDHLLDNKKKAQSSLREAVILTELTKMAKMGSY